MTPRRDQAPHTRLAVVLFAALVLASIANGLPFLLKRVGWLEPQLYAHYRALQQSPDSHPEIGDQQWVEIWAQMRVDLYRVRGAERYAKALKELVVIAFLLASLAVLWRSRQLPRSAVSPVVLTLLALVAAQTARSAVLYGSLVAAAGLRSFVWLFLSMLGGWAATRANLSWLAGFLLVLLCAQLCVALFELSHGLWVFYGLPVSLFPAGRATGTLLNPTSLGCFAVLALAFCQRHLIHRAARGLLVVAAVFVVLLSGSGSAMLLLVLTLMMFVCERTAGAARLVTVVAAAALFVAAAALLPDITGRDDVFQSMWGRMDKYWALLGGMDATELLFGRGVGVATTALHNLVAAGYGRSVPTTELAGMLLRVDSTPLILIAQIGGVGCGLALAVILRAAWRDPVHRPFHVVALGASLTVNLVEFFPVYVVVGLVLAHNPPMVAVAAPRGPE